MTALEEARLLLFRVAAALRYPIPAHRFPISFELHLALDRITTHLAAVLDSVFVAVDFPSGAKGDLVTLQFAVLDLSISHLPIPARGTDLAGNLVTIDLQFRGNCPVRA